MEKTSRNCIFITGASRGIGHGIALELAQKGYDLLLHARQEESFSTEFKQKIQDIAQVKFIYSNLSNMDSVQKLCKSLKQDHGMELKGAVLNAGLTHDAPLMMQKEQDIQEIINVNLMANIYLAKTFSKIFLKNKYGNLIFISSIIGEIGNAYQSVYAASKAALIGLTKSLAKEWALLSESDQLRVNTIAPGLIETAMTTRLDKKIQEKILEQIPLNRMGTPAEIGKLVSFLLSPDSSFLTGQTLHLNGGSWG